MKLTVQKTGAMFMHYVHTEHKPVRDAAELVANRRLAITGTEARPVENSETVSRKFDLSELSQVFTLPWSAYVRLLPVKDLKKLLLTDIARTEWLMSARGNAGGRRVPSLN
ncbi:hypothetical protein BOBR111200_24370 [Bordetella bronchialis]|uniref:Uncharacterized protein n=1 Tax=Bordetella bronchialis TaxID=463025 RepID=A0ABN4R611_9BORD|nr:hypothetical protein BAU06_19015 [Bordetella bronchialis]